MLKTTEVETCLAESLQAPMESHGFRFVKRDSRFVHKDSMASLGLGLSVTRGGPQRRCHVACYLSVRLEEVEALIERHSPDRDKRPDRRSATVSTRWHNAIPRPVYQAVDFNVTSHPECSRLGGKIYDLFVTYGLPWLERHSSYEHLEEIILAGPPGAVPILSRWKADAVLLALYALQGRMADYDRHAKASIASFDELESSGQLKSLPQFLPRDQFEQLLRSMRPTANGSV